MRTVKLSAIFLLSGCVALINGCTSELEDLRVQNNTQRARIADLESELQVTTLQLEQLKRQLETTQGRGGIEVDTLKQRILTHLV